MHGATMRFIFIIYLYLISLFFFQAQIPTSQLETRKQEKKSYYLSEAGTAVAQWLRRCATNLKVAGSIPAGVIGIFH